MVLKIIAFRQINNITQNLFVDQVKRIISQLLRRKLKKTTALKVTISKCILIIIIDIQNDSNGDNDKDLNEDCEEEFKVSTTKGRL